MTRPFHTGWLTLGIAAGTGVLAWATANWVLVGLAGYWVGRAVGELTDD